MKFDLTLATILVFLVPGSLVFFMTPFDLSIGLQSLRALQSPPSSEALLVILVISFFVGVVLDSLRTITIQPAINSVLKVKWFKHETPALTYFKKIDNDTLPGFEMIVEKSFAYYRLNANLSCGLLLISAMQWWTRGFDRTFFLYLLVLIIWFAIATKSKLDNDRVLTNYFK